MPKAVPKLDAEALQFFATKGLTGGRGVPVGAGEANGARVRRVLQVTADLAGAPLDRLRVLDLACGDGVFSIEAALAGAEVVGVDARNMRMSVGEDIAKRLGLKKLSFQQGDIRRLDPALGQFDVIYALGILYHLDLADNLAVLRAAHGMCRKVLIIDTSVGHDGADLVEQGGAAYHGVVFREHEDQDAAATREARPLASVDNTFSFMFTKAALCRALADVGFTSVFECRAPFEPTKPSQRITLVAVKGTPATVATYPWINGKGEDEIAAFLKDHEAASLARHAPVSPEPEPQGAKGLAKALVNGVLRPLGLEVRRRS